MTPNIIYKNIDEISFLKFLNFGKIDFGGDYENISATRDKHSLKNEFGEHTLQLDISKLPKDCEFIDVVYDFNWFTSSQNKNLLLNVTGKSEEDWIDWAKEEGAESLDQIIDIIDNEIVECYSQEAEVVIINLKEINLSFAKPYKSTLVNTNKILAIRKSSSENHH
ncbi:hypothetical protein GW796_09835 [archaeon]|nr:hypothetical protein [archaeon]